MGVWAAGLSAGDFAMDLRSTVGAITRPPFAPPELLSIVRQSVAGVADRPDDADHTVFWLVAADQLHKRARTVLGPRHRTGPEAARAG